MKKILLLILFPFLLSSQIKKTVKFNYPVKDYTFTTKSLEVIDLRKEKKIKDLVFRGKYYSFRFPTDDLSKDIENWFDKTNKKRDKASNEIVLLIEDFNITNATKNGELYCVLTMKFSTFLKKEGGFYYLKRYDNVVNLNTKEVGGIPNLFVENTQKVLQSLMFETYRATPFEVSILPEDLYNYDRILRKQFAVFSSSTLKNGVYLDFTSFYKQTPLENYQLRRNSGEVVKATNEEDDRIPARKFFCYVEGGKAYKNTQSGFLEVHQDKRGFFINANRLMLFPEEIKITPYYLFLPVIETVIASTIEYSIRRNNSMNAERYPIYIDFLTGNYNFIE